jgi:hypothetical protein
MDDNDLAQWKWLCLSPEFSLNANKVPFFSRPSVPQDRSTKPQIFRFAKFKFKTVIGHCGS